MKKFILGLMMGMWALSAEAVSISSSLTDTTAGASIQVHSGDKMTYDVSGTFVGTVILESSQNLLQWNTVISTTGSASGTILVSAKNQGSVNYRFRCDAYTSGTIVAVVADASVTLHEFKNKLGETIMTISDAGVSVTGTLTSSGALSGSSTGAFTSGTFSATTNQFVLGTTHTTTVTVPAPVASNVYTLPDVGTTGSFVMTASTGVVTLQSGTTHSLKLNNLLATNGVQAMTLLNGPAAATVGDPVGWAIININGTDRYMPFW